MNRICKNGIWDESIPDIEFDSEGICNYSKLFDNLVKAYPRGDVGKFEWEKIVNRIKRKGAGKRYDCIVGIS